MAKKTIISDFSDLKGKVTFSEKKSGVKVSDEGLKVGQSVVLMDSDLRGKIVGLGKTVRIKLEDGLVIESAYREFAVTDKAEIASLIETGDARKSPATFPSREVIMWYMIFGILQFWSGLINKLKPPIRHICVCFHSNDNRDGRRPHRYPLPCLPGMP